MSDWLQSRAKARLDRREHLDTLTTRTRYEVRLHATEPAGTAYDNVADVFTLGHYECADLLVHRRLLPLWERLLLTRYARRLYGKAVLGSVHDLPRDDVQAGEGGLVHASVFRTEIATLVPASGDSGAKYDLPGRGLLTTFRLAVGEPGAVWEDRSDVRLTSANNVLVCSDRFLRRKPWHIAWPVYRVRGLRVWKV
ncbi:MAG: hypothetical protein QOI21_3185 [Actinomycetota bacterium]|jgi:hypothetical protein|nr:hypothetical protein [Actinomycetota bacterium]